MKLTELQTEYLKTVNDCTPDEVEERTFQLFQDSFQVRLIGADDKLAMVRAVNIGCIKKIGEFEYIDYGLQKIAINIAILNQMTDLELDGANEDGSGSVANYDIARRIGLYDYLWSFYKSEMSDIEDFIALENRTIVERNGTAAIIEKKRAQKEEKEAKEITEDKGGKR